MQNSLLYLSQLLEVQSDNRKERLEAEVDFLLRNNQEKLLWILYRLDVDEQKLMQAIADSEEADATIVTRFLLARCEQILKTRKEFKSTDESPDWSFDV